MASFEDALNSAIAPVLADATVTEPTVINLESEPKEEAEAKPKEEPKVEEKDVESTVVEDKAEEAPKEEPKEEPKEAPKEAPKEEPKVEEPVVEPKDDEPASEPKAESVVEAKPEESKEEPVVETKEEPKVEEAPKEEPKVEPVVETKESPVDEVKVEPVVEEVPKEEPVVETKEEPKSIDDILSELDLPDNKLDAIKAIVEAKPAPAGKAITTPTQPSTGNEPETDDGKSIAVTPAQEEPSQPAEPQKVALSKEELQETMDKFIQGAEAAFKDVALTLGQDGKDGYRRALSNVKHGTFTPDDILILDRLSAEAASRSRK
jgi:hypothetical protein